MERKHKKPIIGVLVSGIMDDFTKLICQGAVQAARTLDVNIVVMPGKYLARNLEGNREIQYEYQHNTIFSYARKENVDAILVAADCIGCLTTRSRLEELMQEYAGIPTVLIASKLKGYVNVTFDNYTGIREGLEYLIHTLKCKRIGMIGGPEGNFDAWEREQAFLQTLSENGLKLSETAFARGNLSRDAKEVFSSFLDKNPDLEAVVCVNDDTALGLYEELKKRNIIPGKDISVLGYDNTINAAKANPALSSVEADPVELGKQALVRVMEMLEGKKVESLVLPTKFVQRHSFCSVEEDEQGTKDQINYNLDESFDEIFYRYNHEDYRQEMEQLKLAYKALIENIILSFEDGKGELVQAGQIMDRLEDFLARNAIEYADTDHLIIAFEKLHRILRQKQSDQQGAYELRDMFSAIYRKIIQSMDYMFGTMMQQEQYENYAMKLFIRDSLKFESGGDRSYASLLEHLDWLKIRNAFLYLLKNPIIHLNQEKFVLPKHLYLKAVLKEGKVITVPSLKQKQSIECIYANSFMDEQQRYCLVLLPLFYNEMLYGVLLCDLTDPIYENGEFLINQISIGTKMINLLKLNEQIQQQLEDNLVTLRENNIVLDNLSKSDSLTGILNRRGFDDGAQKLLEQCRSKGQDALVIYVDMNNLKIINDRYGHEEGDFALKLISGTLEECIGNNGLVGRIGGDEFVCVMEYDQDDEGKSVLSNIYQQFEAYNADSPQSYNVTVSAGGYVLKADSDTSLQEAISAADERLYEVKRERTKDVAKRR